MNKFFSLLLRKLMPTAEYTLRYHLRMRGATAIIEKPSYSIENSALRNEEEVKQALEILRASGLPPHPDPPKNWDALIAISEVVSRVPPSEGVLDAGGTLYSPILPWLYLMGYKSLYSVDLELDKNTRRGPIRYLRGDLTQTDFPNDTFGAVTCLSVIEHGVQLERYCTEMARILRPGGVLITSTDYWQTRLDLGEKKAYGVPVKVFTEEEIKEFVEIAKYYGLRVISPLRFKCEDKVVYWRRLDMKFTYCVLVMEKS